MPCRCPARGAPCGQGRSAGRRTSQPAPARASCHRRCRADRQENRRRRRWPGRRASRQRSPAQYRCVRVIPSRAESGIITPCDTSGNDPRIENVELATQDRIIQRRKIVPFVNMRNVLFGCSLMLVTDIRLTSSPYKGSGPSVAAVLAGDTQLVIVDAAAIAAQIRAGKIKGLAIAGPTRLSVLPDVPTVAEAGMPAYKLDAWVALFAP